LPFGNLNVAQVHMQGMDVRAQYAWTVGGNRFALGWNSATVFHLINGYCDSCVATEVANTYSQPPHFRTRANFMWGRSEWQFNAALNYTGSYTDTSSLEVGRVSSFTTTDFNILYSPDWLAKTTIALAITNAFNVRPPYVLGSGQGASISEHYDPGNASVLGRFISLRFSKAW